MEDTRKTIFIEKPVDRAVLVFQLSEEMTRLLPTEEYDALYEDLKKMVAAGVVLLPHGIECAGWVAPEGIVREEAADCMPDTKEDW